MNGRFFDIRRQVVDACLRLAGQGFLAGTGGNVSLRCDEGHFAITPSGVDYYSMSAEDICVVEVDTLEVVAGERRPSVESGLHAEMLRFRHDASAVIHTHQPLASAVALLNVPIPIEDDAARRLLGDVIDVVSYAPSGTKLLVRALRKQLRYNVNAYTLRNHGLICCGSSMTSALETVEAAERAASRFLWNAIERRGAASELAAFALASLRQT